MEKRAKCSLFHFTKNFSLVLIVHLLRFSLLFSLSTSLLSCEGAYDIHGRVFDYKSHRGLDSVQVIMVVGKKDTIWKCKPSITSDNHNELFRDDYQLAFTDTDGYYSISSGLIGMGPEEQYATVIFIKKGYAPVILPTGVGSQFDSVHMHQQY